jgi:hypothetical protein
MGGSHKSLCSLSLLSLLSSFVSHASSLVSVLARRVRRGEHWPFATHPSPHWGKTPCLTKPNPSPPGGSRHTYAFVHSRRGLHGWTTDAANKTGISFDLNIVHTPSQNGKVTRTLAGNKICNRKENPAPWGHMRRKPGHPSSKRIGYKLPYGHIAITPYFVPFRTKLWKGSKGVR